MEITVADAAAVRETALLLDCREPEEFALARIDGGRLIPIRSG